MRLFGITLLGMTPENIHRLWLTILFVAGVILVAWILRALTRRALTGGSRGWFLTEQLVRIGSAALIILGVLSIWVSDPARLGTVLGLASAGIAIALQRVITSIAGYFVILRSGAFVVGDRITIGGVRGDVVALDFTITTVMEMGQEPAEQGDDPSIWVEGRQYTGRIVRVTNDKIFDTPIYNFTREFPYVWEELHLPIKYDAEVERAQSILLAAATRYTTEPAEKAARAIAGMRGKYFLPADASTTPKVYLRLTDNWVELTLRFVADVHSVRDTRDAIGRQVLAELSAAKIEVASATFELVGSPPITVRMEGGGRTEVDEPR